MKGSVSLVIFAVAITWVLAGDTISIQGKYRPGSPREVTPMTNITNLLGYMVFKNIPDDDKIVSPISLLQVLFMLYFGTQGSTRAELDQLMQLSRFGLTDEEKIERDMTDQIFKWKNTKGQIMDLTRAYSAEEIFEPYNQQLKSMFDAQMVRSNFLKNATAITADINEWIAEKTSGNINPFFKETLDTQTRLVLISIITFKFGWQNPFSKGMSRDGIFYNRGVEEAYATYMYKEENVDIGFNNFAHSVTLRLPYANSEYDMYIIGPYGKVDGREATIGDVERLLKQTKEFDMLLETEKKPDNTIGVEIPRFVVSSEVDVKSIMNKLGVRSLFTPEADLKRMSAGRLFVSSIRQAGYAKINEAGTEAGVVTAATASSRMVPMRLKNTVTFNKPFIFVIRNNKLNLNLFVGKISHVPKSDY